MKSSLKLRGVVKVYVKSLKGDHVDERVVRNLVVNVGKQHVADLLIGASAASFNFCGVGSSNQAPSPSDTDLIQPLGRKQVTDRFRAANKATFSTFFSSQEFNGTWRECGLFTAETGVVMLARAVFSPEIVKDQSKTVTVDWDIEVA